MPRTSAPRSRRPPSCCRLHGRWRRRGAAQGAGGRVRVGWQGRLLCKPCAGCREGMRSGQAAVAARATGPGVVGALARARAHATLKCPARCARGSCVARWPWREELQPQLDARFSAPGARGARTRRRAACTRHGHCEADTRPPRRGDKAGKVSQGEWWEASVRDARLSADPARTRLFSRSVRAWDGTRTRCAKFGARLIALKRPSWRWRGRPGGKRLLQGVVEALV